MLQHLSMWSPDLWTLSPQLVLIMTTIKRGNAIKKESVGEGEPFPSALLLVRRVELCGHSSRGVGDGFHHNSPGVRTNVSGTLLNELCAHMARRGSSDGNRGSGSIRGWPELRVASSGCFLGGAMAWHD